jgi:hypothetical protein
MLDFPEEAFNEMAFTVEMFVVGALYFSVFFGGMTACTPFFLSFFKNASLS